MRQLKKWKGKDNEVIVCMDTKEDIYRRSIGKALTDQDVSRGKIHWWQSGPAFFQGSKPFVRGYGG